MRDASILYAIPMTKNYYHHLSDDVMSGSSSYCGKMPMVSVVIPVYNTGIYLDHCLESVVNQSLKDIEIICVDDCSSDDSVQILEEYEKRDDRFVIIKHDTNCGLLRARGDGVKASSGKYIIFLDSDDSIEPDTCEELSSLMERTGCDIIQFGTNVIPEDGTDPSLTSHYINFLRPHKRTLTGDRIFEYQFGGTANWHLWNKIYRAELCKKSYDLVKDRYMIVSDDLYISFYLTYLAEKMKGVTKKYYNYHIGRGYINSNNSKIKQIRTICDNSWFISDCIGYLEKEGTFDRYRKYCFREPLLQLGACVSIMDTIDDEGLKNEALGMIRDSWSFEPFKDLLQEMVTDDKWNSPSNRIRRHIADFGVIKSIRIFLHILAFNSKRKVIQLFLR